jgi:hypothetical protein
MKRHTRPYGCTFTTCNKSFGSKNDWKRHETSQHYQHETWRCSEKINGASCTKPFLSAGVARTHLTKVHKVTDPETIDRKINAQRISANNQANFWCGFCERIIDLNQKGLDAWTERFSHIDDHFMGKNWKPADAGSSDKAYQDSSDDSSPVSSDTSSVSQTILVTLTGSEAGPASKKRKRTNSDSHMRANDIRNEELAAKVKDILISEFSVDLFHSLGAILDERNAPIVVPMILPDLLKEFAIRTRHGAQTMLEKDATVFVHRYRRHLIPYYP